MKIIIGICSIICAFQNILCSSVGTLEGSYDHRIPLNNIDNQAIIGGKNAKPGLWIHMLYFGFNEYKPQLSVKFMKALLEINVWELDKSNKSYLGTNTCAGSVIHRQYILTAAHCLRSMTTNVHPTTSDVKIKVGDYTSDINKGLKRTASLIIIHPDYKPNSLGYDLALIKVDLQFFVKHISVVNLITIASPLEVIKATTPCYVAGWGYTKYDIKNKKGKGVPHYLQELEVQYSIIDTNEPTGCSSESVPYFHGNNKKSKRMCNYGDSGAPMICKIGNIYQQIGVLSDISLARGYNRFSNVTSEITWIESYTK